KRRRQRLGAHRRRPESDQAVLNAFARGLVGSDMLIADDPQIETLRLLMPYRRSRLRDRGGDRGRERGGARLEQSPPRGGNRIVHRFLSVCAHVDLAVSADRKIATILIGGSPFLCKDITSGVGVTLLHLVGAFVGKADLSQRLPEPRC